MSVREILIFDKEDKEIATIDPLLNMTEDNEKIVIDNGYGKYVFEKCDYARYEVRDKEVL